MGGAVMLNSQAYVRCIFLCIVFSNLLNTVESGHRSAFNSDAINIMMVLSCILPSAMPVSKKVPKRNAPSKEGKLAFIVNPGSEVRGL